MSNHRRVFEEYPKWKYAENQAPVLVQTHSEEANLGEGWYDKPDLTDHETDLAAYHESGVKPGYEPEEYPKWLYAREIPEGIIVQDEDEEDALDEKHPGVEFFHKPDFTNHGQGEEPTGDEVPADDSDDGEAANNFDGDQIDDEIIADPTTSTIIDNDDEKITDPTTASKRKDAVDQKASNEVAEKPTASKKKPSAKSKDADDLL